MNARHQLLVALLVAVFAFTHVNQSLVSACTGITLKAADGTVVYGRTLEWGHFDMKSRTMIIPPGHNFAGTTPEGRNGFAWTAKYGTVGVELLEADILADGMNEKGLTLGLFYHPGYATPERMKKGLEFTESYLHTNGVTLASEPGGFLSKPLQDMENAVFSDADTDGLPKRNRVSATASLVNPH